MHLALPVPAAAALVVALASPAAAAPADVSVLDSAFARLASEEVFVFVDGFSGTDVRVGAVEVFAGSVECFQPQPQGFSFSSAGTSSASMTGSGTLECFDSRTQRAFPAQVTADLAWAASGRPAYSRSRSAAQRCTSRRWSAPATVTGSVRIVATGLTATVEAAPSAPAELVRQVDRCVRT